MISELRIIFVFYKRFLFLSLFFILVLYSFSLFFILFYAFVIFRSCTREALVITRSSVSTGCVRDAIARYLTWSVVIHDLVTSTDALTTTVVIISQ